MSAGKITPQRIWIKPCDPCDRLDDYYLCDPKYLDGRETAYIRADLPRPSQAGDESVARLVAALRLYHDACTDPKTGSWAGHHFINSSALLDAWAHGCAALAAMDTPKGGGDEGLSPLENDLRARVRQGVDAAFSAPPAAMKDGDCTHIDAQRAHDARRRA